jgi:hypothetical protein
MALVQPSAHGRRALEQDLDRSLWVIRERCQHGASLCE